MSAITAALSQIDRVAADGRPRPRGRPRRSSSRRRGEPIVLPDGRRTYPP